MANSMMQFMAWLFFDRRSGNKSYHEMKREFERTGAIIEDYITSCEQTDDNHGVITHLIGMEYWIQNRIQVALGDPFIEEEYDGYRPPSDISWDALLNSFREVRAKSYGLCDQLQNQNVPQSAKIMHNDLGDLTVGGWLIYLNYHSVMTVYLRKNLKLPASQFN